MSTARAQRLEHNIKLVESLRSRLRRIADPDPGKESAVLDALRECERLCRADRATSSGHHYSFARFSIERLEAREEAAV